MSTTVPYFSNRERTSSTVLVHGMFWARTLVRVASSTSASSSSPSASWDWVDSVNSGVSMVAWDWVEDEEALKIKGLLGLWVLRGSTWERGNEEVERERMERWGKGLVVNWGALLREDKGFVWGSCSNCWVENWEDVGEYGRRTSAIETKLRKKVKNSRFWFRGLSWLF